MKFASSSAYSFGKSFKGKLDKTDLLTNPGPGAYQPGMVKRASPHWKIGTEQRSKSNMKTVPGPGQYNLNTSTISGPKYSMRVKTQNFADPLRYNVSPGPANYNPNFKTLYRNFSYTMRSRPNTAKTNLNPGPGNYNLRTEKSLIVPTYRFGSERKLQPMLTSNRFSPGPGNYNLNDESGARAPKFSFGKELRVKSERPKTPGPGTYQFKTCIGNEGPKITISNWRPLSSVTSAANLTPGPGQYQSNLNDKRKSPSYRIGSAKRSMPNKNAEFPGPGTYSALNMSTSNRPNSPTWSMGKGLRGNLSSSNFFPGPGNYETRSKVGEGPKFSIRGKYDTNKRPEVPGPGQYNNDTQRHLHKTPSWRIGTSTREDVLKRTIKENVPGPGNYNYHTERTMPSYRFGTQARDRKMTNYTPGPGQYHIPSSMVDVPRYLTTGGGFNASFRYI